MNEVWSLIIVSQSQSNFVQPCDLARQSRNTHSSHVSTARYIVCVMPFRHHHHHCSRYRTSRAHCLTSIDAQAGLRASYSTDLPCCKLYTLGNWSGHPLRVTTVTTSMHALKHTWPLSTSRCFLQICLSERHLATINQQVLFANLPVRKALGHYQPACAFCKSACQKGTWPLSTSWCILQICM